MGGGSHAQEFGRIIVAPPLQPLDLLDPVLRGIDTGSPLLIPLLPNPLRHNGGDLGVGLQSVLPVPLVPDPMVDPVRRLVERIDLDTGPRPL